MVEARAVVGIADVHAGTLAYRVEPLEDPDRIRAVAIGVGDVFVAAGHDQHIGTKAGNGNLFLGVPSTDKAGVPLMEKPAKSRAVQRSGYWVSYRGRGPADRPEISGFRRRTGPCASALRQRQREDGAAGAQRDDETDNIAKDAFHGVFSWFEFLANRDMGSRVSDDNIPRLVIFARAKATIEVASYATVGEALRVVGEARKSYQKLSFNCHFWSCEERPMRCRMLHVRRSSALWTGARRAINCRP